MRVLVLSSFTKSLRWFRMDFMRELLDQGHEVFALGSDNDPEWQDEFSQQGIIYDSFRVSRNGVSPIEDILTFRDLCAAIREIAPDKVFAYQAKSIVYGCPAARRAGVSEIYPLVAGLGSVFRGTDLRSRLIRSVLGAQYRQAFRDSRMAFFQNSDDSGLFTSLGLLPQEKVVMLNGSGVNVTHYSEAPLPPSPAFLFIGRLLGDKGVWEYLEAARVVQSRHPGVRFMLLGPLDTNPSALTLEEIAPYVDAGCIEYVGEQVDVRPFITASSVFVLPSYHEGTPKSVLEAMAMGRAIITTDAPGCRETVTHGLNGFLVPPRSVDAIVDRMEHLIGDGELVASMGKESRRMAEDKYDVTKVNHVIMQTMGLLDASNEHRTPGERGE